MIALFFGIVAIVLGLVSPLYWVWLAGYLAG